MFMSVKISLISPWSSRQPIALAALLPHINKARGLKGGRRIHPDQVLILYDENRDGPVFRIVHPSGTLRSRIRSFVSGIKVNASRTASERAGSRAESCGHSGYRSRQRRQGGDEVAF